MYVKQAGEDLENIISGITRQKGRIHLAAGRPVNWFLAGINHLRSNNDKTIKLAELIDSEMTRNYRIWPSSYIAYDMLQGEHNYSAFYSQEEKEAFLKHMQEALSVIESDTALKRDLLLKIYANPFLQARHL